VKRLYEAREHITGLKEEVNKLCARHPRRTACTCPRTTTTARSSTESSSRRPIARSSTSSSPRGVDRGRPVVFERAD
jgi:hypothetical protein